MPGPRGSGSGFSAVQAAREEGLLTAEQAEQVLTGAAQGMAGAQGIKDRIAGSAAQCETVMAELRDAVAD
ncbi:MAG: hypothetical protein KDK03_11360 [Rhodobacteraceae bacterium]|nr:hypothetical protein [Paracoccaceae bacterium]